MRFSIQPILRAMLVLSFFVGSDGFASEITDAEKMPRAITLQEAVSRALANNPGIGAANIDVDIQRARRDAAALSTPYTLRADVENVGGSGVVAGFDAAETTVSLSKVVELGDKRRLRTELGDTQVALAELNVSVRALELSAEVSRRYADVLRRQEQQSLSNEGVALGRNTLEIVERRVAVGRASEAERSSAVVASSRTRLLKNRLTFELDGSRAGLASLWGKSTPDFERVSGDIYSIPPLAAFGELEARLANNPELSQLATESRIRSAAHRLAESTQRPDIEILAGVRHLADTDDAAMVLSLNVPFGSKRRNEPLVREANDRLAQLPFSQQERELQLRAALYGFFQSLLASRAELDGLRASIIPEAENAVTFYQRGYEIGSNSLLELLAAQEQLLALKNEALGAASSHHLTLIEIESLLGNSNPGGALK